MALSSSRQRVGKKIRAFMCENLCFGYTIDLKCIAGQAAQGIDSAARQGVAPLPRANKKMKAVQPAAGFDVNTCK
jgi:hypothetical protein